MAMRALDNLPSNLAIDANALTGLKQQARASPEKALRAAAGQFEALFMQMLLKSMRESLPQDGPLQSDTSKMITGMFDQQLAQQLANKGLGIADMMVKQLSRATEKSSADGASDSAPQPLRKRADSISDRIPAAPASVPPAKSGGASVPGAIQDFVDKLRPAAEAAARAAGLPVTYLLAQAGLETGWGRHVARNADGAPSHNLFGIKAGKSWAGAVADAKTTEYKDGQPAKTVERFRSYASYSESLHDFARLVRQSPRYSSVAANATSADAYALGMQKAGYATDPDYGAKLARAIRMVERHNIASAPTRAPQVVASAADITESGRSPTEKA